MTKSRTGHGEWTRGRGSRRRGIRGRETRDVGTRGLGDSGTRGLGDVGLGEVGFGDAWRLGDVMNKPDFCAEFVKQFSVVLYSFSRCIRGAACFWRDEKNNSDERDTRLKRLSSYSN